MLTSLSRDVSMAPKEDPNRSGDRRGVSKHLPHFTPKPLDDEVDSLLSAMAP